MRCVLHIRLLNAHAPYSSWIVIHTFSCHFHQYVCNLNPHDYKKTCSIPVWEADLRFTLLCPPLSASQINSVLASYLMSQRLALLGIGQRDLGSITTLIGSLHIWHYFPKQESEPLKLVLLYTWHCMQFSFQQKGGKIQKLLRYREPDL